MKFLLHCLVLGGITLAHAHAPVPAESAPAAAAHSAHAAPRAKSGLAVGAALAPDGRLWLSGLDEEGRLFLQVSDDLGQHWGERRLLDVAGDQISADGENRPKIAFGPANVVVISYTRPLAKPYTGEIRLLRSSDGGQTFAAPQTVHQDRQVITHRFESIAFDAAGHLHVLWIDKRDLVRAGGKGYRGAAIYRAESSDGGLTFGPDTKVADYSCECCRIALAPTPDGGLVAMWRHVFEPNIRDHAFVVLGSAAPKLVRATFDEWKLDACPHHGPGLAPAAGGGFHAVWFGERGGVAAMRYGRLAADGAPVGSVSALPDARAEHADVVSRGRQVAVVWRSYDGRRTRLRAWVSNDDGGSFALRELADSADENDHPRLLSGAAGLLAVWRTRKEVHVLPIAP